jgi:hypothetical protein
VTLITFRRRSVIIASVSGIIGCMSAGWEFHGRIGRVLRGLMVERSVIPADVARIKGATEGAVRHQLRNHAVMPLADLVAYAEALHMTPTQLMAELAQRVAALEAADAQCAARDESAESADYVGAQVMAGLVDAMVA